MPAPKQCKKIKRQNLALARKLNDNNCLKSIGYLLALGFSLTVSNVYAAWVAVPQENDALHSMFKIFSLGKQLKTG